MNPSCMIMPAEDAGIRHRFIGTFGHPCTVPVNRQAGPAAMFRFLGLQAGDGLRRFAYSAVTPTIDFTGRFSINGQQGTNFNTAEYFRLAHLPLPAQENQPDRLHHSSLLGCLPGWAVPAPTRLRRPLTGATCQQERGKHGCDGYCGGRPGRTFLGRKKDGHLTDNRLNLSFICLSTAL